MLTVDVPDQPRRRQAAEHQPNNSIKSVDTDEPRRPKRLIDAARLEDSDSKKRMEELERDNAQLRESLERTERELRLWQSTMYLPNDRFLVVTNPDQSQRRVAVTDMIKRYARDYEAYVVEVKGNMLTIEWPNAERVSDHKSVWDFLKTHLPEKLRYPERADLRGILILFGIKKKVTPELLETWGVLAKGERKTATEIRKAAGVGKEALYRHLRFLMEHDFVIRDADCYVISPRLASTLRSP